MPLREWAPPLPSVLQTRHVHEHLLKVDDVPPASSLEESPTAWALLNLWGCCWHLPGQQQRAVLAEITPASASAPCTPGAARASFRGTQPRPDSLLPRALSQPSISASDRQQPDFQLKPTDCCIIKYKKGTRSPFCASSKDARHLYTLFCTKGCGEGLCRRDTLLSSRSGKGRSPPAPPCSIKELK